MRFYDDKAIKCVCCQTAILPGDDYYWHDDMSYCSKRCLSSLLSNKVIITEDDEGNTVYRFNGVLYTEDILDDALMDAIDDELDYDVRHVNTAGDNMLDYADDVYEDFRDAG